MIVYADRRRALEPASAIRHLRELARSTAVDDLVEGLILAGELEAGVADAWSADLDDLEPRLDPLRATTLEFARAVLDATEPRPIRVPEVRDAPGLPAEVEVATPEGTAFYALYPEAYARAVRRFASGWVDEAVVIGLRTIGTLLAAVVHAALEDHGWTVRSCTVRPRGDPWDRAPRLGPGLASTLRAPWVLVVDEGPGLSGSSLAGTAAAVSALGIPDERIVLVPSWSPDPRCLRSATARERWPRHRKLVATSDDVVDSLIGTGVDWSAGRWRQILGVWPAVEPRHERIKRGCGSSIARFVGLGEHGRAAAARAQALADAGLGPQVRAYERGFLWEERVDGTPASDGLRLDLVPAVVARLQHARSRPTDRPVPRDELVELVAVNLAEAGLPVPDLGGFPRDRVPTVEIDGRMAAHEWLLTGSRVLKADGFDHCADHFFPGCQDLAWDVAAVALELGPDVRDAALEVLGDRALAARVPWYELAYGAWRLGYATMARDGAGGDEARRWGLEVRRLRAALGRRLR